MFKLTLFKKMHAERRSIYLILLILAVSIIPRIWKLSDYPPLIVDEPANIRDVDIILEKGINPTSFHWDSSKSQIVHLPAVLLIKLGINDKMTALRSASVIIGLACLIPFFAIAKRLTNLLVAFSSTLLFASSYYLLQFSRVGWTDLISGVFLGLMLFWVILKIKYHNKSKILYVIAGIVAGLLFYGYRSGIITILAALVTLFPKKIRPLKNFKTALFHFLLFITSFTAIAFPWIKTAYHNNDRYNLRLRAVSIKNTNLPYHGFNQKKDIIKYQVKQTLYSWVFIKAVDLHGTESARYLPRGFQIVNWFVKIGFWVGLFLAARKISDTYPLFLVFIAGLYGQVRTVDPPNGARGLLMLPCIYLFFAIFLYKVFKMYNNSKLVGASIIFLSILFSLSDFIFYTYWMTWIKV